MNRRRWQIQIVCLAGILSFCLVTGLAGQQASTDPINGVAGLGDLRLDQVVFAGTHNSAAGYRGVLRYWGTISGGTAVSSGLYRNQEKSFTEQLTLGVRYFDIDTAWNPGHPVGTDWWKPKGAWMCHSNAYAGPVQDLVDQVDTWMKLPENAREVVVLHFNHDVYVANDSANPREEKLIAEDIIKIVTAKWNPTVSANTVKIGWKSVSAPRGIDKQRKIWPSMHQLVENKPAGNCDDACQLNESDINITRVCNANVIGKITWIHICKRCL